MLTPGGIVAPPALPGIVRVTSLNILGVTMTNGLSASDHVRGIISDCAQTLYAFRVLRAHSMCDDLQIGRRRQVVSYCMRPVLGRDLPRRPTDSELTHSSAAALAAASVHQTFGRWNCPKHPTSSFLAKLSTTGTTCYTNTCHLRHLPHSTTTCDPGYTMPDHSRHLTDCNFFIRLLYNEIY